MGGHELAPVAVGEPLAKLPVERAQLGGELPGRCLAPQLRADPLHDLSEPHGVEPDMGVHAAVLLPDLEALQHVDRRAVASARRLLEGGLEPAARVEDEVGRANPLDVARRELDVVGLGAGRCQIHDLDAVASDLLGGEGERVEAGHDLRPPGRAGGVAARRTRRLPAARASTVPPG